jgi:hypothetical protein
MNTFLFNTPFNSALSFPDIPGGNRAAHIHTFSHVLLSIIRFSLPVPLVLISILTLYPALLHVAQGTVLCVVG